MPLSDDTRAKAREIIARYPQPRSALLPMLHLVQAEEGYVTPQGVALCAEELGLTKAEVGAVATFYTMYKRRPVGEYLVSVCTNLSCQVLGGEEVYAELSKHLGVGHDETAPGVDGGPAITLEHAECLAACDYAPVMTVNYEFYDNVTEVGALETVRALQRGERPLPTRGAPLCSFREASLQLAGFVEPGSGSLPAGAEAAAPAHPDAPRPDDRRGRVDLEGSDVAVGARDGYGVPGGETERTLPAEDAAATYGDEAVADAGATPEALATSPRRDEDAPLTGQPQDEAGEAEGGAVGEPPAEAEALEPSDLEPTDPEASGSTGDAEDGGGGGAADEDADPTTDEVAPVAGEGADGEAPASTGTAESVTAGNAQPAASAETATTDTAASPGTDGDEPSKEATPVRSPRRSGSPSKRTRSRGSARTKGGKGADRLPAEPPGSSSTPSTTEES